MVSNLGLLQELPDIPTLLPQGGGDREKALRYMEPRADWKPWLILR